MPILEVFSKVTKGYFFLLVQGDLNDESEVLEWLIIERSGADDVVRKQA
jgi:hypothetical protein